MSSEPLFPPHLALPTLVRAAGHATATEHATWMRAASLSTCDRMLDRLAQDPSVSYTKRPTDTEMCSQLAIMTTVTDLPTGTSTVPSGLAQHTHQPDLLRVAASMRGAPHFAVVGVEAGSNMTAADASEWSRCALGAERPHEECTVKTPLSSVPAAAWSGGHARPRSAEAVRRV